MPLLLLGLVPSDASRPDDAPEHRRLPGIAGMDALVLCTGSHAGSGREAVALEWAVAQAAILSAYAAQHDVLPVALGAAFSDARALEEHLAATEPQILAERSALAGTTEYIVVIDKSTEPPVRDPPKAEGYLQQRQTERNARRGLDDARHALVARSVSSLSGTVVRLTAPSAANRNSLISFSALLRRDTVPSATAALERLAPDAAQIGLSIRMIGPCAPFSFVARDSVDA